MADPLFDMAVNAGLFPGYNPATTDNSLIDPSSEVDSPASLVSGIGRDTLSEASAVPNKPGLSFTSPDATPGSSTLGKVGGEVGVSSSGKGFSANKAQQIDAAMTPGYQGDLARADAAANAWDQGGFDILKQAHDHETAAAKGVADATIAKIQEEGHQANLMAGLQDTFARDEQEAELRAQAQSQVAMNNYMAALADFRATKIDPGQWWGNLPTSAKVGTLASVFVHDFLGVKGMHTSAMDTLNAAIDRNINAQVQNLHTKGEVAEGFKSLWYMQRHQAASDAEARVRVRGLMLEGMKQQVIAHMSQFDAGLASAQGQAAIAALDEASAKNFIELQKHIDANKVALRQQATAWNVAKMNNAQEGWANAIRAKQLDLEAKKFAASQQKGMQMPSDFIINPETNKAEFVARPGTRPETVDKAKEVVINATGFTKALSELRAFERSLPPTFDPLVGTRLSNEQQREYDALVTQLAHNLVHANGEKATDQDVVDFKKSIPMDTYFTNGGVARILAATQSRGLVQPQAWIQQYFDDVPKQYQFEGPKGELFAGTKADATAVASGKDKEKSFDQTQLDDTLKNIRGPQSGETDKNPPANAKALHDELDKRYPSLASARESEFSGSNGQVNEAEKSIAYLALLAKESQHVDGKDVPTPAAIKAYEALKREAQTFLQPDPFNQGQMDWRGAAAALELEALSHDGAFQSSIVNDPGTPSFAPKPGEFNIGGK